MSWFQTINRNVGQKPVHKFTESTPIEFVQNEDFYTLLYNDLAAVASPWESYPLGQNVFQLLPEEPGLYMFIWSPNALKFQTDTVPLEVLKILYVGKASVSIKERFRSEYRRILEAASPSYFWEESALESRELRLKRLLSLSPIDIWFCRVSKNNVSCIDNLETRLIKLINPPGNVQRKLKPVGLPQAIWR